MRRAFAADPLRLFAAIASPERCRVVAGLWRQVENDSGSPIAGFDPGATVVATTVLRDRPAIVVTLPPPVAPGEAYFIGMVLTGLPRRGEPPDAVDLRYFTLERAGDAGATTLCEWDDKGRLAAGEGPAPQAEGFLAAIAARL